MRVSMASRRVEGWARFWRCFGMLRSELGVCRSLAVLEAGGEDALGGKGGLELRGLRLLD